MTPELVVYPDAQALGQALAAQIADAIEAAADRGQRFLLGCPGGRSPRTTYEALTDVVRERRMDLRHLVIVMMDDYVVPDGSSFAAVPESEHFSVARFAREVIVNPLTEAAPAGQGIRPEHLWFPDPREPQKYDGILRDAGGVDLFIIASGDTDGHIAFNPPGSPADCESRIVTLAETTRSDNTRTFPAFAALDEVPRHGVSVGIATIRDLSQRVVLVAPGASKKMAVETIMQATTYDPQWPATVLVDCHHPLLLTDDAALGRGKS
jgi:glucosamine-6-phosphate deaminase